RARPPARGGLWAVLEALGTMITLVGGALALVGSRPTLGARAIYTGSGLLLVFVLSALCLGVFGAYAAPGLSIGVSPLAATFDLAAAIVPGPRGRGVAPPRAAGPPSRRPGPRRASRPVRRHGARAARGSRPGAAPAGGRIGSDGSAARADATHHARVSRRRVRRESLGRRSFASLADWTRARRVGHPGLSSRRRPADRPAGAGRGG